MSDSGKGIKPELVAHLFDERTGDRRAGAPPGTGMGLYIARMLTELHGGSIALETEAGKGTLFTVTLPHTSNGGES